LQLSSTSNDLVSHNSFYIVDPYFYRGAHNPLLSIANASGTVIDSNDFGDSQSWPAIVVTNPSGLSPVIISRNRIDPTYGSPHPVGIEVIGGDLIIRDNVIHSTSGIGVELFNSAYGGGTGRVLFEGNDFRENAIGVSIHSPASSAKGSVAVDLGGGTLGSLG